MVSSFANSFLTLKAQGGLRAAAAPFGGSAGPRAGRMRNDGTGSSGNRSWFLDDPGGRGEKCYRCLLEWKEILNKLLNS